MKSIIKNTKQKLTYKILSLTLIPGLLMAMASAFTQREINDEFFKQFGITKSSANERIINSFLGGFLDAYGLKEAKNIALNNRTEVTLSLLEYAKTFVAGDEFKQAYTDLREQNKPEKQIIQTPEAMQADMVQNLTKSIAETEAAYIKADESMKAVFEPVLASSRQMLKDYQDPDNAIIASYRQNYDYLLQMNEQSYQKQIQDWEKQYPANPAIYIKRQLQQFLTETDNIDFKAGLIKKNDVMVFEKSEYEAKSNNWKMAFRAGKEVVQPAREFVTGWITEIK